MQANVPLQSFGEVPLEQAFHFVGQFGDVLEGAEVGVLVPAGAVLVADEGSFLAVLADAEEVGGVAAGAENFVPDEHADKYVIFIGRNELLGGFEQF